MSCVAGPHPCHCTGACRRVPCAHNFVWHGVIPPTHCSLCGAPLQTSIYRLPPVLPWYQPSSWPPEAL